MVHTVSNTKQKEFNEKVIAALVIAFILIGLSFVFQYRLNRTNNIMATNIQTELTGIDTRFESSESDIRVLESKVRELPSTEFVTDRDEALREGMYDFYEEFKDFVRKAEARLPIMRKL